MFKPGQLVDACLYQEKENWADGLVVKRFGRILYKIEVEDELRTRPANLLRIRLYDYNHKAKDMDMLFETFGLEHPQSLSQPANIQYSTAPVLFEIQPPLVDQNSVPPPHLPVQEAEQLRRSGRTRIPMGRFDMDPRYRSYST
ncbi:unnamed protein product [Heligmosomoides polygyrus]|uniref:Tudor domain-containing protein n=1 Tax=Heligmosomoides polygyrus TaxID=6339 RepID=A0A183FK54_HELPZ|nr:unnamed protein product [Heligmosomoides polygyrus]